MARPPLLLGLLALGLLTSVPAWAQTSTLWDQFVQAKADGTEPTLADFSYAGYEYSAGPIPERFAGERVYDVTAYGADPSPDDEGDDQPAIQAAIDAAEADVAAGTATVGVVYFPPGRYRVHTEAGGTNNIKIESGGIVLRGAGRGVSEIHMVGYMDQRVSNQLYSVPFMFEWERPVQSDPTLATVTADARRESFCVAVDDASGLEAGRRVRLEFESSAPAVKDAFSAPYDAPPSWTSPVVIAEPHVVDRVETEGGATRVCFREPLHLDVEVDLPLGPGDRNWHLSPHDVREVAGVEDLTFRGGWTGDFSHHRSALDDSGWSAVRLDHVANAWIRRVDFVDWNRAVDVRHSAQVSVLDVTLGGTRGHSGITVTGGYGVLVGLVDDRANHYHGPNVGLAASGTVYWRLRQGDAVLDAHTDEPYATLLDCSSGGFLRSDGGALPTHPNHLRDFTLWNYENTAADVPTLSYWDDADAAWYVKPIVVGSHGYTVGYQTETLEAFESLGTAVQPECLFEAQLERRLGAAPGWLAQMRAEFDASEEVGCSLAGGTYRLRAAGDVSQFLRATDGGDVQVAPYDPATMSADAGFLWSVRDAGEGWCQVESARDGAGVLQAPASDGAAVVLAAGATGAEAEWEVKPAGDDWYRLRSRADQNLFVQRTGGGTPSDAALDTFEPLSYVMRDGRGRFDWCFVADGAPDECVVNIDVGPGPGPGPGGDGAYYEGLRERLETEFGVTGGDFVLGEAGAPHEGAILQSFVHFNLDPSPVREVDDPDLPFTAARTYQSTEANPTQPFRHRIQTLGTPEVEEGDVLLAAVYLKGTAADGSPGEVRVRFDRSSSPFNGSIEETVTLTDQWTLYLLPFEAASTYAAGESRFQIYLGPKEQTVDVAGVQVINYGDTYALTDLPRAALPVAGEGQPRAGALTLDVFPNPMTGPGTVRYQIQTPGRVTLEAFDLLGRRVAVLDEGSKTTEAQDVRLSTEAWPTGVYLLRLHTENAVVTRKVVVAR